VGVELLTDRYKSQITGVLSCYDRIIIVTHPARLRMICDASDGDPPAVQMHEK